jgi:hypothetical protein
MERGAAVVIVSLAVGVGSWLLLRPGATVGGAGRAGSGPAAVAAPAAGPTPTGPQALSSARLRSLPAQVGHDVFWLGRARGDIYEVTLRGSDTYIRYLPSGTPIGDPRPVFVTVGSYGRSDALRVVRNAHSDALFFAALPGGAVAVSERAHPQSVYLAFPRRAVLVEVYAPKVGEAIALVRSGRVRLVR